MKTKNPIIVLLFLICSTFLTAQKKPKIKGNRSVVSVKEYLPAFKAIQLNDDIDIVVEKATEEGYEMTADDNLLDIFKFEVMDSTLVISSFYKVVAKKKLNIKIYYKELEAITLRDGNLKVEDRVSSDKFYVNAFGLSKLTLDVSAAVIDVFMEGNAKGELNVDSDSLSVSLKGKSGLSLYSVGEKANIELYKNASVAMEGSVDSLNVKLIENTGFKGLKYQAANLYMEIGGSSTAKVYAFNTFELVSKDNAKTTLGGNPKISITEFLNKSLLRKEED